MMKSKFTIQHLLCFLMLLSFSTKQFAQISIPNPSFTHNEDFSTLASSGTSSTVPAGWAFFETGSNANTLYTAGTGSGNAGDTYSFGLASNSERAFGGLQSGSLTPTVGVCYTNNTGSIITGLTITYTGETWRFGATGRTDRINFEYNANTTAINGAGTWVSVPALDYINAINSPVGGGTMLHSANLSANLTGLSIANGATFCFRWVSFDASGADDGMAVDDYSLSALTTVPVNDLCANATPIVANGGNICGTTIGAGADLPNGGADCDGPDSDAEGQGVWYTFTGDGQAWDFFFPASGGWDPEVNVYSGTCASLTCVVGDDDSGGGLSAAFTVNTVAGVTYYVYVHPASSSGGTSDFCFTADIQAPPCTITVDFLGNPSACNDNGTPNDPTDDFFTQNVRGVFFNRPLTDSLRLVPGGDQIGSYAIHVNDIIGNQHVFNNVQFKADGTSTEIEMHFTAEPTCIDAATGPSVMECSEPCTITVDFLGNPSACNDNGTPNDPSDDFFTQNVRGVFFNRPLTDSLRLVPGGDQIGSYAIHVNDIIGNQHVFNNVQFKADGTPTEIEMHFTAEPTCIDAATGPTVNSCSAAPPCEVIGFSFANISSCNDNGTPNNAADDYFTVDVSVLYSNSTNGDSLILTGGDLIFRTTRLALVGTNVTSTFSAVRFRADGQPVDFTGQIGTFGNIHCSLPGTGPAVNPCSAGSAPINDLCANAIPLICGDLFSGNTAGAGDDIALGQAPNCSGGATAGGVWYYFVGDGGTAVINTCAYADYNTSLAVYSGSCGALTCVASNDDFCGTSSQLSFQTVAGTTYRILVYGAGEVGDFGLQLICFPPNGSATVACPALAVAPTPPVVMGGCGPLAVTGPVITDNPTPLTCEGTRTFTYTYIDNCGPSITDPNETEANRGAMMPVAGTWSFVYTIERLPFTISPSTDSTTVSCLALAVPPTALPVVLSNCGEVLTPSAPAIVDLPSPLSCEGTRSYVYTYTDCEGNTRTYTFQYRIERLPFTVPANGSATVACLALATPPTPPVVLSNCGETLPAPTPTIVDNPSPLTCEGTRTYSYVFTDCEGNTATWSFVYTIERSPFTVPANGSATVACPALATQPVPPVISSNCGEVLSPTNISITNVPNPITCEGTRTYTFTFMDCEGNTATWSFVYTIERQPFTVPANGAATVNCPANATQPVPPVVLSNCGEVLTPTGPVVTNVPNPITCEGTRTFTWTFTDCEGNSLPWSFVYTIERQPFTIATPNGSATVDCPDDTDAQPVPPVVLSNCGEVLTPVVSATAKPFCEGTRTWSFTYTDCEGNTATWTFTYTIEYLDFAVPPSVVSSVECPLNAIQPTPPTVFDNCGKLLTPIGPIVTSTPNAWGCEGSRKYEWMYKDCEGNTHFWSQTYNILYTADFFVYPDVTDVVGCLAYAVPPAPPTIYDICGQEIKATLTSVSENISPSGCSGWRKYTFTYTDCGGHSHPWSLTYNINDDQAPVGTCPSGSSSAISVDVDNLTCIEDVPCPEDDNFQGKVEEMLEAGNYFDVCYGDELFVTLDSYTNLWQCSDPDGDGNFTFGRTFYFRIADRCGNEYPSLCEVTYSGACQPLETYSMEAWGIEGGAPGNVVIPSATDLQVITTLLNSSPVKIGGNNRSITLTDAQCVMDMLPGIGGPAVLANCQQTNCTGCNPMGVGGIKNTLAANAIALELNIRFNMEYKGLTLNGVRNQGLGCIYLHPCIYSCNANGTCVVRFFDAQGMEYDQPYTIGGLQDLVNLYLDGSLGLTLGQKIIYGTALNQTLLDLNDYFGRINTDNACQDDIAAPDYAELDKLLEQYNLEFANGVDNSDISFELMPNPTSGEVTFSLREIAEGQEVSLDIFNQLGQVVLRKEFGRSTNLNERIDLEGVGSGLYIVRVKAGDQYFEQKLVVGKN